jgi:hypothetical protein
MEKKDKKGEYENEKAFSNSFGSIDGIRHGGVQRRDSRSQRHLFRRRRQQRSPHLL